MGRAPCCEKVGLRRGRWSDEEDKILSDYIQANGEGSWRSLPKKAGLLRCGKSCRLRWINYLRCDVKRGNISKDEEDTIIKLHASIGNKWSLIAAHLGGGRTDNEIKNYWNSHLNPLRTKISHTTKRTRRRSSMKNKKKPLQASHSNTSSLPNDSEKEKEKELEDDCSGWLIEDEGGLLMMVEQYPGGDQNALSVDKETDDDMRGEEEVKNTSCVVSMITKDTTTTTTSKQVFDNLDWDWDFEEEDNSMLLSSWPWDDENNKKQADAIIAWLLS